MRIVQVDAFTDRVFQGNPAAVCVLDGTRPDAWLAAVAGEMNLSETAFVRRLEDGFELRWFTPVVEVDLCGHATLAAAHVLWEDGLLSRDRPARFHTRSGLLTAILRGGVIAMDFPATPASPAPVPDGLAAALGAAPVAVGRSRSDLLVELDDEITVRSLRPDTSALARVSARGIIVTAAADPTTGDAAAGAGGRAYDFVSRFFAPSVGVDEDPVTGSAHCTLGPYWAQRLGRDEVVGYQASARGGIVRVHVHDERVTLSGTAVTVLRGELVDGE